MTVQTLDREARGIRERTVSRVTASRGTVEGAADATAASAMAHGSVSREGQPSHVGRKPINSPKVSSPKAKPLPPGMSRAAAHSVTGMVMLKRNTAAVPSTGLPEKR